MVKHMKRCSNHLSREAQIKNPVRYHLTPMSMPTLTKNKKKKSESQAITSVGKETEVSYVLLVGI